MHAGISHILCDHSYASSLPVAGVRKVTRLEAYSTPANSMIIPQSTNGRLIKVQAASNLQQSAHFSFVIISHNLIECNGTATAVEGAAGRLYFTPLQQGGVIYEISIWDQNFPRSYSIDMNILNLLPLEQKHKSDFPWSLNHISPNNIIPKY